MALLLILCLLLVASDERPTGEETLDLKVHATDVLRVIECSILSFRHFVKIDKKKSGGVRSLFGSHNQMATPLQQAQSSLEKVNETNYCFSLMLRNSSAFTTLVPSYRVTVLEIAESSETEGAMEEEQEL